jgi:hypothetical protein
MAYEVLKDNYYRSSVGPLGLELGIRYDPVTGNYELKEKNLLGYDAISGNAIFYENGTFRGDALRDPRLFVDGDPNKITPFAQQLSVDIRKKVYAAYQAKGGTAGGNVVNASARPANQNSQAGVNNSFPGTNPGIATAVPGIGGILAAPPGQGNFFDPGFAALANLNFNSNNEKDIFKDEGLLLYPVDILKNQQDTLQITMYRYRAPLEGVFSGTVNPADIAKNGLQRNSALKERIATTILPIPSGIQDNNAISWGDDSMNNLTAAVTAGVSNNVGPQIGIQAALGLLNSTTGGSLPTGAANQLAALASAGVGLDNPLAKASIVSQILKNAGFEVPAETILARGFGIVPNSNLELLFQGPTLRQFGFTWRMSPRSAKEARNVKRIIRLFKQGSAPRKLNSQSGAGARSFFLGTPNVFKLSYKTGDKEISGLNKFKICALVNMNVIYAPDGQWAAYDEGQPVSVQMTLNFQEIEPVYESDYQEGIFKDNNINLGDNYSPVKPDDVGY